MEVTSSTMYNVMQAAEELGMTQGSYTFLALHVLYTLRPHAQPNVQNNALLRHLFVLTFVSPNVTYNQTWDEAHDVATVRLPDLNGTETDDYIMHQAYDSVALFTSALKLAVRNKHGRFNLSTLLDFTKGVSYQGFLGLVHMSNRGNRDVTYVLLSYDAEHSAFRSAVWVTKDTVIESAYSGWYRDRLMPPDDPCILNEKDCLPESGVSLSPAHIVAVVVCSLFITVCAILVAVMIRKRILQNEITKGPNKIIIFPEDLVFVSPRSLNASRKLNDFTNLDKPDLLKGSHDSLRGRTNTSSLSLRQGWDETTTRARYNGDLVHVKYIHASGFEVKSRTIKDLKVLHDLRHENLNVFLGFLADPHHPALIYEYCSRGSLEDIIASEDIKLDWAFKLSLLTDLVRGMKYVHSCPVRAHGWLTSRNCVIDSRWVLKITDYGLTAFFDSQNYPLVKRNAKDMLCTAPELLRDEGAMRRGSQPGDVYSFGIIMQEVVVRGPAYCMLTLTPEEIIEKVKKPPPLIRPSVSKQAAPPEAINIMRQCWAEGPDMRPDFNAIHEHFKKLNQGKKVNIVDTMFQMLEKYSNNLEELIRERTEQLAEEKKKTEQLLHRMLPSTVAEKLMLGMPVEPEAYEEVTIYFSDIVGFTTISAYSTPMEIVDLLNDLYTSFDATINNYNVYKVETIGDAYMVVGGIPLRIEDHAGQIATMALDLLHQSGRFVIRHMPSTPLKLRIGVHTGPCCTGVVGLTMPRYCLFGDTVNTASRMESTGRAFCIHMSEMTKLKLEAVGGYHIKFRGETELKGRGKAYTYWLLGKDGFDKELPKPAEGELDEEVVRRGRLSSICYSQDVSPIDLASIAQQGANLAVPGLPPDIAEQLRILAAQYQQPSDNTSDATAAAASHDVTLPVLNVLQNDSRSSDTACVTVEILPCPGFSNSSMVTTNSGLESGEASRVTNTNTIVVHSPKESPHHNTGSPLVVPPSSLATHHYGNKSTQAAAITVDNEKSNLTTVNGSRTTAIEDKNGNTPQELVVVDLRPSGSGDCNGNVADRTTTSTAPRAEAAARSEKQQECVVALK